MLTNMYMLCSRWVEPGNLSHFATLHYLMDCVCMCVGVQVCVGGCSVHLHIFDSSIINYNFGLKETGKQSLCGNNNWWKWKLMLWNATVFQKIKEVISSRKFHSHHAMNLSVLLFSSHLLSSVTSSWGHRSQNCRMSGVRKLWLPGDCPLTAGYNYIFN